MHFATKNYYTRGLMNKVSVLSLEKRFKKFDGKIKKTALKTFKILKKKNVSAEIYLAGNQKMRFLNKKFRGKNKSTDVLSFEESRNFVNPPSKYRKIGEIYLNMSDVKGQMSEAGRLLIHGLLHLFGYNHKKKSDRIKMEKTEQRILCSLPL